MLNIGDTADGTVEPLLYQNPNRNRQGTQPTNRHDSCDTSGIPAHQTTSDDVSVSLHPMTAIKTQSSEQDLLSSQKSLSSRLNVDLVAP